MVVDAVLTLDQEDLDESLIGMKKIPGGGMEDSVLVKGVAFKKTFSYAGFEQQPKSFKNPSIVCLSVELELKAERDNAEVRIEQVSVRLPPPARRTLTLGQEYQAIVDAEWSIIYAKLEALANTGAKVILSRLPIGDLATQFFADRDIFCAGRVAVDDLKRVVQAVGGSIQSTCSDIRPEHLGHCESFEEKQIGGERFNLFEGCVSAKTCTLLLRGGAEQFIAEVERSLHDAIMIVKRAIKNNQVVAGGGATEVRPPRPPVCRADSAQMEVSKYLRDTSRTIEGKQQLMIGAFAKALEIIPRQICNNAGLDATDILNKLRMLHAKGETWSGVDVENEGVGDNLARFVWEPSLVKINALEGATEAACLVLSVDETVTNPKSQAVRPFTLSLADSDRADLATQQSSGPQAPRGAQRAVRGRGR